MSAARGPANARGKPRDVTSARTTLHQSEAASEKAIICAKDFRAIGTQLSEFHAQKQPVDLQVFLQTQGITVDRDDMISIS